MKNRTKDAEYHAEPMRERMVAAPWHTALHFNSADDADAAQEMMAAYPDYDALDPNDEDGFYVRVDTLQVDARGRASATSVLWDVRELSRWCHQTLALLQADRVVERAVMADAGHEDEDEDEVDEDEENDDEENEDEDNDDEDNDDEDNDDEDNGEDEDEGDDEGDDPEED
jgi:hypothetical protein